MHGVSERSIGILERLDRWYSERVIRNYTAEVRDALAESWKQKVGDNPGLAAIVREQQIAGSNFFTGSYALVERCIEDLMPEKYDYDTAILGAIGPIFTTLKRMMDFVNAVRDRSGARTASQLPDSDIDSAFAAVFGSHKGFTEFCITYGYTAAQFIGLMADRGIVPDFEFNRRIIFLEAYKEMVPRFNETVFGDIPSSLAGRTN